jgi:hypothetical protein
MFSRSERGTGKKMTRTALLIINAVAACAAGCSGESMDLFGPELPGAGATGHGVSVTTGGATMGGSGGAGGAGSMGGIGGMATTAAAGGAAGAGMAGSGGSSPEIDAGTEAADAREVGVTLPPTGACAGKSRKVTASDPFVSDFENEDLHGWYDFGATGSLGKIAIVSPGAAGTARAGHLAASALTSFGAGMGFGTGCWDVSSLDGVSFWAKGTAGSDNAILVQVAVPATHSVEVGGDCMTKCNDHPSAKVTLTPQWKLYAVRFSDLTQAGFGATARYEGVMMALNWVSVAGPSVDLSVDEVALFAGAAPTGPVGRGRGDAGK